jgi:MarR family transcriptional regulator, organic hydroperoxide resistance regulator
MTATDPAAADRAAAVAEPELAPLDELRAALNRILGAERRLRGREQVPGELTHAHIRSLQALAEQGELTAGQLAKSADLNPASVTAMLDHLEGAGIVSRTRSTTDRRVTNVALTPDGRELLAEKSARWKARWSEQLAQFSDAELAAAARVNRAIAELLDTIACERERESRAAAS